MKNLVSVKQLQDKKLLARLFKRADDFAASPLSQYPKPLTHMTMATLFFEPSTRTRLSFETAIQNLGGHVITVENASDFSSAKKGESLEDTIRTVCAYADGIIMRHPDIGSAEIAAKCSSVPFINAGDGGGEHPTQALLDLYSIQKFMGKVDGLKVALVGDLKNSRSHHSLLYLLSIFNVELHLIAPKLIELPEDVRSYLKQKKVNFKEVDSWGGLLKDIDVLYMNRIQKERFKLDEEYQAVKNTFTLTTDMVKTMKQNAVILNPLPRINEIHRAVDDDPRAKYFEQVKNGLYTRMALLEYIFAA